MITMTGVIQLICICMFASLIPYIVVRILRFTITYFSFLKKIKNPSMQENGGELGGRVFDKYKRHG